MLLIVTTHPGFAQSLADSSCDPATPPLTMGESALRERPMLPTRPFAVLAVATAGILCAFGTPPGELNVELRSRVEVFKGSNAWREVLLKDKLRPDETAIVVCDMWDNHCCKAAARRCGELAPRMNDVLEAARAPRSSSSTPQPNAWTSTRTIPQRQRARKTPPTRRATASPRLEGPPCRSTTPTAAATTPSRRPRVQGLDAAAPRPQHRRQDAITDNGRRSTTPAAAAASRTCSSWASTPTCASSAARSPSGR